MKKSELVIVSNRLPVHRAKEGKTSVWRTSPGGLVSALTPILRDRPSTWIGWAGTSGSAPEPFAHEGINNLPISLSAKDIRDFYEGFSNRTLWPLYHDAVRTPEYRRYWWYPYREVNQRFAEAAVEAAAPQATIWVHDYHLQLVPGMIRARRSDVRIGFFLHIPFPPQELFAQLPWRTQVLEGLLGADVVGFQTRLGAQNFTQLCRRFTSAVGSRDSVKFDDRRVRVDAFPVSIDVEKFERVASSESVISRAQEFRARLGPGRKIMLGVDRLDYTKGIDNRLRAYQDLLRSERAHLEECVLVQVAVPSRARVIEYRELREKIERLVGEINGEFGELGRTPIHYLHRSLPLEELVALYRAADVMLVTPLRDGMNLVAKEYIASRLDDSGVLVLSEFTGSARELSAAVLVNPHDIDGMSQAFQKALHMPQIDQNRLIRSLRRAVKRNDVFKWAHTFLAALRNE